MYSVKSTLDALKENNVDITKQTLIYHIKKNLKPEIDYILMNQYVITKKGFDKIIKHYKEYYPNGKT